MKSLFRFSGSVFLVIFHLSSFAQEINWNTSPDKGFVFQISNKEAQRLLTNSSPDTIFNRLLHTQIDTFDVRKGWVNRPSKGHFITAKIIENKLHCEYTSVFPYQVFLLKEYDALALQVLDLDGNIREDALVKLKLKRLRIDPESKAYRIENAWFNDANKFVTVELDGFRSVFNVERHDVPTWNNNSYDEDGPSFYSYLITDKNKYKPKERVRFKSFALSQSRSPLHKPLEVWMSYGGTSTKVGKVEPHRPGSYSGEFVLHDSLKLTLDRNYNLQLRERGGRIVSNCNFKYEDYELNGNKLEVHLATNKQYLPAKNELSILATDLNGLILKDARAAIVVEALSIRETFQPVAILKDTLMYREVDLETREATIVDIPSRLFEKTNTAYEVHVRVTDGQNQIMDHTVAATHFYSQYEITARFSNDSIIYEMLKNGIPIKNISFRLMHNGDSDSTDIILPYKEKINPVISSVRLQGDSLSKEISMRNLIPELELVGGIEKDSFNISLHNAQKIEVSWFIYQGSELLQKGFGIGLDYKSMITDRDQTYYVELLYSFGSQEHIKRWDYEFREDVLNVSLDVPDRVFPGQQADATIKVIDQLGNPVNGVDLTALAVTGKLNYRLPDLPYYGRSSQSRSMKAHYSKSDVNKRLAILDLDFKKWEERASLDTMMYFQFTYPYSKMFTYSTEITDSTQFAPFVMQDGVARQVHVIEVNRKPVYYSWVDQPREYSFYVSADKNVAITLRMFDRVLILDSLSFPAGKKTILSIDLDHLPEGVKIQKIEPTSGKKRKKARNYSSFTETEINRHLTFLSSFKTVEGNAYLESGRLFTPLFNARYSTRSGSIIVGPIKPGKQTFTGNKVTTSYQHTGGFNYAFEDNIVYKLSAERLIPEILNKSAYKPMTRVNDLVMTRTTFLESIDTDNRFHTRSINLFDKAMHLNVLLPEEKDASGFAALLFENVKTRQIISPCENRVNVKSDYYTIPYGLQNVIILYNSGKYVKMDSIDLIPYSKVIIDLNKKAFQSPDSLSRKWLERAISNCYRAAEPRVISMRRSVPIYGNIKGIVYDESNLPLPGTNVVIKGTVNGTVTDAEGEFALDSDDAVVTLVVSFIGFVTKEVEVEVGSELSIYMIPDVQQLQEIVVTGYGMQRSQESLAYALSGMVSGVQISPPDLKEDDVTEVEKKQAEEKLYGELLTLSTIRSHFTDVGFWEPKLYTDNRGESKFSITFPDDITRWETTVYAMNRYLQTGTARKSIRSYKPIMAELNVPQFLTRGDSAFFIGRVLNYTQEQDITGKVKWSSPLTGFEKDIRFSEFHTDWLPIYATTTDSITSSYIFNRNDGYFDGEERKVPVVEQGIVRSDGTLTILSNKEEFHVKASSKERVIVEILSNQLDIYTGEAKYLLNYRYDCNEQLASKLLGLIQYRMLMVYEGKPFRYDKDVNRIIGRLLKNQNEEFLWSWWDVSPATSYWMSSHILRALKAAADAGYKVGLNIDNIKRKAEYKFDILNQYALSDTDLLHALAWWGANLAYDKYVKKLDSLLLRSQKATKPRNDVLHYSLLKEKFLLQEIKQLAHLPYERDTLLRYRRDGILGEIHFSDDKAPRNWYDDELSANVIAYRIARRDSLLKELVNPMQMYFIKERNKGEWNTYHSSTILTTVLPDLINEGVTKRQGTNVNLSGKVNSTINTFPYRLELLPQEELHIRKETGLPVYLMQYEQERIIEAKTGVEGFEIKTTLANNQPMLKAGTPVQLTVEVTVKKDANHEYVMIEVPIPGACSYGDKAQSNSHVETHREYFKDRTVIFCEKMKQGKYNFVVNLLPRFTGRFLINPAQVSLMYLPVVNANTDLKMVKVD